MNNGVVLNRLFDLVEQSAFNGDEGFVDVSFAQLALAISMLPAGKREAILRAIEEGGALTTAVAKFHPPYSRQPQDTPDIPLWLERRPPASPGVPPLASAMLIAIDPKARKVE
jgi:hypothetical protein